MLEESENVRIETESLFCSVTQERSLRVTGLHGNTCRDARGPEKQQNDPYD
jgi:hypothetical protein